MNLFSRLQSLLALRATRRSRHRNSFAVAEFETRNLLAAAVATVNADSAFIVNGTLTAAYASVCQVGDSSGFFGSGTLIDSRYVLTAAHVADGVTDTDGVVQFGNQTYKTTKVFMHPDYDINKLGEDDCNDIAIYKLDRPVAGITPSPIYRLAPKVGQLLTLVGFGGGGNGTTGHNGDYGIKRVGTTPIDLVTATVIHWNFDNNSESNTAPGDSGGPAFVTAGGALYVAGVTSGGTKFNAAIGDNSYDTRVDSYSTWIDSIVGAKLPTISVTTADSSAAETKSGQTADGGQFVITRTGATNNPLTVNLAMSGTATNGSDYSSIPTKITIPAGSASVTVNLTVKDDSLVESTELATLAPIANAAYSISSTAGSATVTITDNESPVVNDSFAKRTQISGSTVTATGSNVGATRETGEPLITSFGGGKSVWWTWKAPSSGSFTISTAGSSFDTVLGVYQGTAVNTLKQVVVNDDENYSKKIYTSRVVFSAVAGQVYQIAVDGRQGASGTIKLALSPTTTASSLPPRSALFDSILKTN